MDVSLAGDWLMSITCSLLASPAFPAVAAAGPAEEEAVGRSGELHKSTTSGLLCCGAAAAAADGADRETPAPVAVLAGAALDALFLTGLPEACT